MILVAKQVEHAPIVFTQWWFWLGLIAIILVFRATLFKNKQ